MVTRPAFLIDDLEQARAAVTAAVESNKPILLLTRADSAAALGLHWSQELANRLRREYQQADILGAFDCGDRVALAHEALRAGAEAVCFTGPELEERGLGEVAASLGRILIATRPPALDMGRFSPKRREAAAKAWLGNPPEQRNVG
jgi:hypothetical protein